MSALIDYDRDENGQISTTERNLALLLADAQKRRFAAHVAEMEARPKREVLTEAIDVLERQLTWLQQELVTCDDTYPPRSLPQAVRLAHAVLNLHHRLRSKYTVDYGF